jgi:hypothetical protein
MGHCGPAGTARRLGRVICLAVLLSGLALGVTGCTSAVDAWRSVNGTDINDPNPKTAPFTGNMTQAFSRPYPNLGSVPPPPTEETSTAERNKLTQALIADRGAAAVQGVPPPGLTPAAAPLGSSAAPPPQANKAAAHSVATGGNAVPARKPGEPPEPQPLNSSLIMPTIAAQLPQPQAPQPPPTSPNLAVLPAPPGPALPAQAIASAAPAPPPQQPVLAPIAAPPALKPPPKPRPVAAVVATLDIAAGAAMGSADREQLARVAALYKEKPAPVRVVAFAAAPPAGADPLTLYHAALDRAQGIARALAADGIPAGKIQTEATPASGAQLGRIEIQFAP